MNNNMSESNTQLIFNLVVLGLVLGLGIVVFFNIIPTQQQAAKNPIPKSSSSTSVATTPKPPSATPEEITKYKGLIKSEILTEGTGVETKTGQKIEVNYTGTLLDGTQFDTSIGRAPFSFTLGAGGVIKGWDYGLEGQKVGSKIKLTLPPEVAYGERATGKIPANSTLLFDVEILRIIE
jgi:FKBP-type peptidyl-prolyl cis-trans isomerase FkpA